MDAACPPPPPGSYGLVASSDDNDAVDDYDYENNENTSIDDDDEEECSEWRLFLEGPVAAGPAPGFRSLDFRDAATGESVLARGGRREEEDDEDPPIFYYGRLAGEAGALGRNAAFRQWLVACGSLAVAIVWWAELRPRDRSGGGLWWLWVVRLVLVLLLRVGCRSSIRSGLDRSARALVERHRSRAWEEWGVLGGDTLNAVLADVDTLTRILLLHVVPGRVLADDLECSETIETLQGQSTRTVCSNDSIFQKGSGNVRSNLPEIISTDIQACNGVIHILDGVLLPGDHE